MLIAEYGASGLLPPIVLLAALLIDAIVGEFGPLFRVLPHPVSLIGALTGWLDRRLNRARRAAATRAVRGAVVAVGLAAALAVLDIIENENLLERGLEIGARIAARFNALASNPELLCVGDARSLGAMNAIEIVKNRDSREPDGDLAAAIIAHALTQGLILIGAGPARNVIRVLVPLTAPFELIDEGLDILEASIGHCL